jgi:3-deoxy-D-manno-octulosonate 8-phosphate phosphatase (KDO 8-P phosphatase)
MPNPLTYPVLVLDVDGTMTDGGLYLDDNGVQTKRFDVTDGSGIKYYQRAGGTVAFLTGRSSRVVDHRAAELGVTFVMQGALDKSAGLTELLKRMKVSPEKVAYMGDDLPDIPAMRRCGYRLAPANATAEVKAVAHFVAPLPGGHGAVRQAVEHLLQQDGAWDEILARYLPELPQPPAVSEVEGPAVSEVEGPAVSEVERPSPPEAGR